MNRIKLITDSVCDISIERAQKLGVEVVPLTINLEGKSYVDGVEMKVDELFRRIKGGAGFPTTSQVSPGVFQEIYRKYIDEGYSIISIHLSQKLSGTYNSAVLASQEFDEGLIEVIDSASATGGQLVLVEKAAELIKEGKSLSEIRAALEDAKKRYGNLFLVDTLEFLIHGGRVGKVSGLIGGMLGLKPLLMIEDGAITAHSKVRGAKNAMKALVEKLRNEDADPSYRAVLVHSDAMDRVKEMEEVMKEKGISYEVIHIGSVVGVHIGPGACGYFLVRK